MSNPTLSQFLDSWQGEQSWLRAQGSRIYLEWDQPASNDPFNRIISQGKGVFGTLAAGRHSNPFPATNWMSKENDRGHNFSERPIKKSTPSQFIFNARSKPTAKFSDMAKLLAQQRYSSEKPQGFHPPYQSNKNTQYGFKFPCKRQQPISIAPAVPVRQPFVCLTESSLGNQSENLQSIMESIREIKLPEANNTPEYRQASRKFESMKQQILSKIMSDQVEVELNDILAEIQEAADLIIIKHKLGGPPQTGPAPTLKKNIFSFNECMLQNDSGLELNPLDGIDEDSKDHSNLIKLPPFKDDGGSISSISDMSRKRDEDSGKNDNILIANAQNQSFNGLMTQQSVKECKIEEQLPTKFDKTADETISNQTREAPKPTIAPKPSEVPSDKLGSPSSNVDIIPLTAEILPPDVCRPEEKFQYGSPKKCRPITTYLPHTPNSPLKIATNLEEAKEIDPNITKFTEYPVKIIEAKAQTPQIISYLNPTRFCRKEEVVKKLVANHIVERESNSIEFAM